MVLRKLTWIGWIEIFIGAILPAICLGRFVLDWFISSMYFVIASVQSDPEVFVGAMFGALIGVIGVGALVFLWVLLLMGAEWVNHRPTLRWMIIVFDICGVALSLFLLYGMVFWKLTHGRIFSWREHGAWMVLIGPVVVGLRYLPSLVRPTRGPHVA